MCSAQADNRSKVITRAGAIPQCEEYRSLTIDIGYQVQRPPVTGRALEGATAAAYLEGHGSAGDGISRCVYQLGSEGVRQAAPHHTRLIVAED